MSRPPPPAPIPALPSALPRGLTETLGRSIDEALDLLTEWRGPAAGMPGFESLLDQCRARVAGNAARAPEPLRLVHHFARAGGTVMTRMLGTMPGAVVLSEIDPFSDFGQSSFAPTDLVLHARKAPTGISDDIVAEVFLDGVAALHRRLSAEARHLVLRIHSHSRYCRGSQVRPGAALAARLAARFELRQIVTLRHPLDSYASLIRKGWVQFAPATLEEYSRRYLVFLDDHAGLPRFHYESFATDPDPLAQQMLAALALPYRPGWADLMPVVPMSGDEGDPGARIALPPRRALPEGAEAEARAGGAYADLCARTGYDPDPEAGLLPLPAVPDRPA